VLLRGAPGAPDKGATLERSIIADDGLNDTQMKQHLAVSAIGGDRTGDGFHELTRVNQRVRWQHK